MYSTINLTDDYVYLGISDRRLSLFENLFPIPRGISYNSYLLKDQKTVLFDTVDYSVSRQFLENLTHALGGRDLDYIIVAHMEPDHCSVIEQLCEKYPNVKIIGNSRTFPLINQFYDIDLNGRTVTVSDGESICFGKHTIKFVFAPMVHWPEVMVCYDNEDKILFSADAFGAFGALSGNIYADNLDIEGEWLDDYRRYYANIVGKYGSQVQALFKKLEGAEINTICPLHGPIWRDKLDFILQKYQSWSLYQPEQQGVLILYGSIYGNTESAAALLAGTLADMGVNNIAMYDLSTIHVSTAISEIFKFSHIVLASPTYNNGLFPLMENLLSDMRALDIKNRTVALMENGSWAPQAKKHMTSALEQLKNINILNSSVTIRSSLKEAQAEQIKEMADEIAKSIK